MIDTQEQALVEARKYPYVYFWNRMGRKGALCRVIARGRMNSCWVEFEDGFGAITSRNALRRYAAFADADKREGK